MADFTVRRAADTEIAAIRNIAEQAYAKYLDRLKARPLPMDADFAAHLRRGEARVIADGAAIVGYVILIPQSEAMLVDNLAVHPDHQGRGNGVALLRHAEQEAAELGLSKMTLYTNVKMTENQALYARFGYREVARRMENGAHRVYMEKRLNREDG